MGDVGDKEEKKMDNWWKVRNSTYICRRPRPVTHPFVSTDEGTTCKLTTCMCVYVRACVRSRCCKCREPLADETECVFTAALHGLSQTLGDTCTLNTHTYTATLLKSLPIVFFAVIGICNLFCHPTTHTHTGYYYMYVMSPSTTLHDPFSHLLLAVGSLQQRLHIYFVRHFCRTDFQISNRFPCPSDNS